VFLLSNCKKENNLRKFLSKNELIYEDGIYDSMKKGNSINLNLDNHNISIAFWMTSKNFSDNGIVFNVSQNEKDELRKSKLTFLISKKRLSIISGNYDFRKEKGFFQNDFSKNFMELPPLNLNEKYFVGIIYCVKTSELNIYVDGLFYSKFNMNRKVFNDNVVLRTGYVYDSGKKKYLFKGDLTNFYILNKCLTLSEINLLMDLTLTNNYPL
jgi:hypothetical protein